jgi:uncharacterized protein
MGVDQVLTQSQAWGVYDDCLADGRTMLLEEPATIEHRFRSFSNSKHAAPKDWADSYLAAFAVEAGVRLVTFDQALEKRSSNAVLLA